MLTCIYSLVFFNEFFFKGTIKQKFSKGGCDIMNIHFWDRFHIGVSFPVRKTIPNWDKVLKNMGYTFIDSEDDKKLIIYSPDKTACAVFDYQNNENRIVSIMARHEVSTNIIRCFFQYLG